MGRDSISIVAQDVELTNPSAVWEAQCMGNLSYGTVLATRSRWKDTNGKENFP
jgi:hypothetical protein